MPNSRFPCSIALRLKKVCYKVSLCENRQRQSCKAFAHCRKRPCDCSYSIFARSASAV